MDKKALEQRLDKMTSILVRLLEDRCATCGKKLLWRYRQAGHFVPRVVRKTRWSLINVHTQCAHCNVELGGNIQKYRKFIAKKYGVGTLDVLDFTYEAYKQGKLKKPSTEDMQAQYNEYLVAIRQAEKVPGEFIPVEWNKIN